MMRIVVGLAIAAAGAVSGIAVVAAGNDGAAVAAKACGTERWDVKTLTDSRAKRVDFHPRHVTVAHLRKLDRPAVHENSPRIRPHEYRVYRVRAQLITTTIEDDSDIHLVIAVPHHRRKTMIVELPARHCTGGAVRRAAMAKARRKFIGACGKASGSSFTDLRGKARVAGVGFWDFQHGQTGVAPNAFELHPVLSFRSRSCRRA